MTSGTAANTAIPRSNREEFMAVLATVDQLVARSLHLGAQPKSSSSASQPSSTASPKKRRRITSGFVPMPRPPPKCMPSTGRPEGSRPWWVVYVGREPGLYTTVEEADAQIKNCPNQQYRRKASKQEALNLYIEKYDAGEVAKWVELKD
ncbi:hypothetical protein B0H12DRAFT_1072133 [Mycena haematopus]|nr:hypothetical protein B0H12DRAFT_1072133 [Mycena haematopus]